MTAVTWWLRPGVNYDRDNCDRITAWAAANGLDAGDMPGNQAIVVDTEQRTMTVTLIVEHTQDGDVVLPPRDVDQLEVRRTVPLIEPPPDDLFRPCDACLRGVRHSHGLPEVPQVTAPGGLSYSEIDVAVAYEKLRDDVQRLRDCLATLVDALRTPAESRT